MQKYIKLNHNIHLNPRLFDEKPETETTRLGFGKGLVLAAKANESVVGLCCDLKESTQMHLFTREFPERFIEIGIAEQNMAGIAAGMALTGKVPFIVSYAAFSPGRNYDQIRVSIAYQEANVKIIGAHAGVSVGPDGATHQMLEDIALMRALPNMVVISAADYEQAILATQAAAAYHGPVYLRLGREKVPQITTRRTPFIIGKANVLCEGQDVTIIANGQLVYQALIAAKHLIQNGIGAEVIDCHSVKPLDRDTILKSVAKTQAVVTAEEAQAAGGLGGAVAELLSQELPAPVKRVGVLDRFGQSGTPEELMKLYGLTAEDIIRAAKEAMGMK